MPSCEHCGAPQDFFDEPCAYCGPLPKVIKRASGPHLTPNYIKMGRNIIVASITVYVTWCFYHVPEKKPQQDKPSIAYVPVYNTAPSNPKPVVQPVVQDHTPKPTPPVVFEDLENDQKQVLLKKQLAELNFVESMRKKRENSEPEPIQETTPAEIPQKQVVQILNPEREAKIKRIQDLNSSIEKQARIVQAIAQDSIPCESCGGGGIVNHYINHENSLKRDKAWICNSCKKIYPSTKGSLGYERPYGNFIYIPKTEPISRKEREEYKEIIYRQQSLILNDLKQQLDKAERVLAGVPLLVPDVPPPPPAPVEPKPRRFYVLQDKEVEVVSEVETGQEVVVKTPKGEFIVLKRKDIKEIVAR